AGCPTTIVELNDERRAGLHAHVQHGLEQLGASAGISNLETAATLQDLDWSGIDVVIECIPERLDIKQALFAELEKFARPDTLLASNSSSFPISAIAEGLTTADRMVGLHFFMPAHLTPLVEVVCGERTAERLDIRRARSGELEKFARPDTLLASNSSSFPSSAIAEGLTTADRMVGLHFFMPAHLTPLVEVVCGERTALEAAQNLHSF